MSRAQSMHLLPRRLASIVLASTALAASGLAFFQDKASEPPALQPAAGASTAGTTGGPGAAQPSFIDGLMRTLPLLAMMGVVFYFIMWRPDQKRRKERAALLTSLKKGDRVVLNSGLYGSIVQVQETVLTLQVAEGVRMRYATSAVQAVLAGEEGTELEKKG